MVTTCMNCGAQIPEGNQWCARCGAPAAPQQPPAQSGPHYSVSPPQQTPASYYTQPFGGDVPPAQGGSQPQYAPPQSGGSPYGASQFGASQYGASPPQQPQAPYYAPPAGSAAPPPKKDLSNILIPVGTAAAVIVVFLVLWLTGVFSFGTGGRNEPPQPASTRDTALETPRGGNNGNDGPGDPSPDRTPTDPAASPGLPAATEAPAPATEAPAPATDAPSPAPSPTPAPPPPASNSWAVAYLEIIDDLIGRFGEGAIETVSISGWDATLMTGLNFVRLIDFDGDGNFELLCAWLNSPRPVNYPLSWRMAVYGYDNGLVTLMEERIVSNPGTDVSPSVTLLSKFGKVYLVDVNEICNGSYYTVENGRMVSVLDYFYDFWEEETFTLNGTPVTEEELWYAINELEVAGDMQCIYFFEPFEDEGEYAVGQTLQTVEYIRSLAG